MIKFAHKIPSQHKRIISQEILRIVMTQMIPLTSALCKKKSQ